jgi:hypothetical protein
MTPRVYDTGEGFLTSPTVSLDEQGRQDKWHVRERASLVVGAGLIAGLAIGL